MSNSFDLKYKIGDRVIHNLGYTDVMAEVVSIDRDDVGLPYMLQYDLVDGTTQSQWASEESMRQWKDRSIGQVIADLDEIRISLVALQQQAITPPGSWCSTCFGDVTFTSGAWKHDGDGADHPITAILLKEVGA